MKKVMLFGTFDIVHAGHIRMFKEAKEYGDYLVVVVARDINVEKIKELNSFHTENERVAFLRELRAVDEVLLGGLNDPYELVKECRPDVIGLGYDQRVYVDKLAEKIIEFGLETLIVRLQPYEEKRFKSSKIKKYIERIV